MSAVTRVLSTVNVRGRGGAASVLGAIAVLLLLVSMTPVTRGASAHGPGSGTVTSSASFVLTEAGSPNGTDVYHDYLASINLPIGPGDTLRFAWRAGDAAPPVRFELHAHPSTGGFEVDYNTTAVAVDDSWVVPDTDGFMVYWQNPNSVNVTVSYTFQLLPPSDPTLYLLGIVLAVAGIVVVVRARRWWLWKHPKEARAETDADRIPPP
jgi:hypothetical protein